MSTNITKWGSSLGVRIPKKEAERAGFSQGMSVEVIADNNQLVITKAKPRYFLDDLVSRITPQNLHAEVDSGSPVGNEDW